MSVSRVPGDAELSMDAIPTAAERANDLVGVESKEPGGALYIVLRSPGGRPVYVGPYQNRDVAKVEAVLVRRFVAAVIREARGTGERPADQGASETAARSQSGLMIPSASAAVVNSSQIGSI
jgi:hypothetical protein